MRIHKTKQNKQQDSAEDIKESSISLSQNKTPHGEDYEMRREVTHLACGRFHFGTGRQLLFPAEDRHGRGNRRSEPTSSHAREHSRSHGSKL